MGHVVSKNTKTDHRFGKFFEWLCTKRQLPTLGTFFLLFCHRIQIIDLCQKTKTDRNALGTFFLVFCHRIQIIDLCQKTRTDHNALGTFLLVQCHRAQMVVFHEKSTDFIKINHSQM
jgi:myo-inositol catabolism protein IolC